MEHKREREANQMALKKKKLATQTPEPGPSDLATAKEAYQFLRMGRTKFYRLRKAGKIPFVPIGDSIRVSWSVLKDIAKNGITSA